MIWPVTSKQDSQWTLWYSTFIINSHASLSTSYFNGKLSSPPARRFTYLIYSVQFINCHSRKSINSHYWIWGRLNFLVSSVLIFLLAFFLWHSKTSSLDKMRSWEGSLKSPWSQFPGPLAQKRYTMASDAD